MNRNVMIVTIYANTVLYKLEGKESYQEKQHYELMAFE